MRVSAAGALGWAGGKGDLVEGRRNMMGGGDWLT
jgi:hypothetical protein